MYGPFGHNIYRMNGIESHKERYRNLTKLPMAFRVLVIDTETSGLPKDRRSTPDKHDRWPRIVQVGAILYKCPYNGLPGRILKRYSNLVCPNDWLIEDGAAKVHGITNEYAKKNGNDIVTVLNDILELSKKADAICCHNVEFDVPVILAEYYRNNLIPTPGDNPFVSLPNVCTMKIGKKLCRILVEGTRRNGDKYLYYKSPKLAEMYKHIFDKEFTGKLHNALEDCEATVAILDSLCKDHVPFLRVAVPDLFHFTK